MKKLIIANWKMQFSHNQACSWIETELPSLQETVASTEHELVICPSFTELQYATSCFPELPWGAQDCGTALKGAYTGEVSAQSLKDMGIRYTIIGHSERRLHHHETDVQVAQKTELLLELGIHPIICIGEVGEEKEQTPDLLTRQLSLVKPLYTAYDLCIIAYEPAWAIGSGQLPTQEELRNALSTIRGLLHDKNLLLLYGGSIQAPHARLFSPLVDGFLLGGASLNSEELKKIILSC